MSKLIKLGCIVWTLPNTLLGLAIGLVGLCSGGRLQFCKGCLEFYGGFTRWFVRRMPLGDMTLALTLGHTILGQSKSALDLCRDHEHIHVRQYEIWGPFFLIAYLGISLWLWLVGKDAYHDNPFEIQAYSRESKSDPGS